MPKLERIEALSKIFGNGLKPNPSPGVDQENWRYIPEENNYAYIGKPDKVRRIASRKTQVVNKVA